MKIVAAENKINIHKDIIPDAVHHRGNLKLKTRLRLSDYIFREVDCGTDKKKTIEKNMGGHRLSELYHFKSL